MRKQDASTVPVTPNCLQAGPDGEAMVAPQPRQWTRDLSDPLLAGSVGSTRSRWGYSWLAERPSTRRVIPLRGRRLHRRRRRGHPLLNASDCRAWASGRVGSPIGVSTSYPPRWVQDRRPADLSRERRDLDPTLECQCLREPTHNIATRAVAAQVADASSWLRARIRVVLLTHPRSAPEGGPVGEWPSGRVAAVCRCRAFLLLRQIVSTTPSNISG